MTQAELDFYVGVPRALKTLAASVAELTKEVKELKATLKEIESNMG
jgi:hypothetical protein